MDNPDGLLTRELFSYLECLQIRRDELETLFQEDEAFWTENIRRLERCKDLYQKQVEEALNKCQF